VARGQGVGARGDHRLAPGTPALAAYPALLPSRPESRTEAAGRALGKGPRHQAGRGGLVWLTICLVAFFVFLVRDPLSGDLDLVRSDRPGVRVLFVGNSLTYYNGMTGMVRDLAKGDRGAPAIFAVQYARPGATLDDALDDHRLRELIADERWQSVVLQENSQITSRPSDVTARVLPAAAGLQWITRARRAQTVLFETWGYEHGLPGYDDSYG
jgi:hypothetical protein